MKTWSIGVIVFLCFVDTLKAAQQTLSRPSSFVSIATMEDDETPKFETYPQFTVNDTDIDGITYGSDNVVSDDEVSIATQAGRTSHIRADRDMFSPDMTTPSIGEMGLGENYEDDDVRMVKRLAQAVDDNLGRRLLDSVKELQTGEVKTIINGAKYRYGVLNYQDPDGRTPLMWALALWGSYDTDEIVKLLVTAGADLDIQDNQGHTVVQYVKNNKRIPQETREKIIKLGSSQQ